jgi:ankyrin repeat protein
MEKIISYLNSAGNYFVDFAWPMLIQSSILIIILLGLDLVLRRKVRAVVRYGIWMLVLVKLVLPPSLTSPTGLGYWVADRLPEVAIEKVKELPASQPMDTVVVPSLPPVGGYESRRSTEKSATGLPAAPPEIVHPTAMNWQSIVLAVWLVGVIVLAVLLLQRLIFVKGLISQSDDVGDPLSDALSQCSRQMAMRRRIMLRLSPNAASPSVCGLFRPVILIPHRLVDKLTEPQLRAVLLHELAHIRRGDLWVSFLQTTLQILYFYNPLLWLANALIRKVREQAVDEMVLVAMGSQAEDYPDTLLNVSKLIFRRPALSLRLIGVVESKSALKTRIKHIVTRPIPKSAKLGITGLVAVILTSAILLPMAKGNFNDIPLFDNPPSTLHMAAFKGNLKAVKQFIHDGIDVNSRGPDGERPLCFAVYGNRINMVRFLLDNGADINAANDSQSTPLHGAAWKGFRDVAELLIIRGAEVNAVDKMGKTPLDNAIDQNHPRLIKLIRKHIEISTKTENSGFKKTLHNGVTVELVGVCEHPSKGKQWWQPDGSLLKVRPYAKLNDREAYNDLRMFEIVYRLSGPGKAISKIIRTDEMPGYFGPYDMKRDIEKAAAYSEDCVYAMIPVVNGLDEVDINIACGTEVDWQWHARVTSPVTNSGMNTDQLDLSVSTGEQGYAVANVTHRIYDKEVRVIAKDKSGKLYHPKSFRGKTMDWAEVITAKFDISADDIESVEVQTQEFQTVEFKNVSLQGGHKTDVEIEVKKTDVQVEGEGIGLVEAENHFSTTLPSGVTVELVGVADYPSKGGQSWWQADGTVLAKPPYDGSDIDIMSIAGEDIRKIELAIKLGGNTNGPGWEAPVKRVDGKYLWSGGRRRENGQIVDDIKSIAIVCPSKQEKLDLRLYIAAGPWENVSVVPKNSLPVSSAGVVFSVPQQTANGTTITVSDSYFEYDSRIIAIDLEDKIYTASTRNRSAETTDNIRQTTVNFDLELSKIKEFRFQTRPYEWVEFKNVSLQPGHKTDVEIEVKKTDVQVEGEERESSNILRRADSETSQSGRALLPEIASKVMIRFQKAIKDSDWTRALSYCSNKVKSKGKEYDSTEAFFKNVLPIDEITALSEFHISGMSRRNDDVISYRCEIRLKDPGSKYSLSWNLSVLKEDSNWVVDLPTKPLDVWLKHENLKMKWMNERYRFDEEKTQKGFDEWINEEFKGEKNRKGFDVRLVSLSEDFVVGKPMLFRVEMKNISNETLGYMHTSFINDPMLIKDSNGVIVHYIDTSYQTAESPEFVEPAETIILADNYDARSQYHITKPGKYTFQFKGLANTKPSNIIEKDIQSSPLPALERIVEDLLPVLPEGWELTRTIKPANELAQTSTANEVLWIHLIGKQADKGRKGNFVSLAIFLHTAAQMPPNVKLKSNLSELDFWGNSKWGLIYAKSHDAQLLWPDYKEKIKNVLQVASPQQTSSGQVDINSIIDSELFIHYEHAGLEEILIQDRELKHIWHTLKQNLTAMRQDISSYDRHEFTKKLNNDELLILRQWQLDNDIFLLPQQFPTADEITYGSAFESSMKVKYDGRNYNAEWTGDSQLPKSVVRAVMELKRICKNLHQVEGEGVGQKREDEQGNAYLDAIIEGNLGKVQELLANDPSLISIIDNRGKGSSRLPALHVAIKYGHADIVELLLSKGAKPNERNIYGQGSLHVAAENGRANMVKLLVQYGAGINDKDEFRLPPLCYASNAQVAEALIANGADVNWPDKRHATFLHSIARSGITEVAQVLLAHGADINAKDNSGWTPLHSAASRGRKDMVEFLITQGADINAKDRGTKGKTPLNCAVTDEWMVPKGDRKATAELLLSHGADFTIYDVTWLGDVTRVRGLLEENPSLANDTSNTYKEPVLFAAIREGHSATAELLLDNGADLNVKDRYKEPPLHTAAYWGHENMVALLIRKGVDVNQKGPHGELALHWAATKGHGQTAQLLVEAGTKINTHTDKPRMDMDGIAERNADVVRERLKSLATEEEQKQAQAMGSDLQTGLPIRFAFAAGDTALHSAAQRGHKEIVELLLANGADVNVTNRWGQTPLHYAVVFRHEEVVRALLNAGADPNAKMLDGSTAHDLASEVKDAELADMLRIEHNTVKSNLLADGEKSDEQIKVEPTAAQVEGEEDKILSIQLQSQDNQKFRFGQFTPSIFVLKNLSEKALVVSSIEPLANSGEGKIPLSGSAYGSVRKLDNQNGYHYNSLSQQQTRLSFYACFLLPGQQVSVKTMLRPVALEESFDIAYFSASNKYNGTIDSLMPFNLYLPEHNDNMFPINYYPFVERNWITLHQACPQTSQVGPDVPKRAVLIPDLKQAQQHTSVTIAINYETVSFPLEAALKSVSKITGLTPKSLRLVYSTTLDGFVVAEDGYSWILKSENQTFKETVATLQSISLSCFSYFTCSMVM